MCLAIERDRRYVALRKESVDRNLWACSGVICSSVALRKESVDRNSTSFQQISAYLRRSPQGERG